MTRTITQLWLEAWARAVGWLAVAWICALWMADPYYVPEEIETCSQPQSSPPGSWRN